MTPAARSTLLMAVGALVGIAIAGYGLFTAKGTVTRHVPPEDVALVNQRPILLSDFIAQAESTYAVAYADVTPAQRKAVLEAMIHEELYVQRGLELDFPATDPDTRNALVAAVKQQAVADATTMQPGEEELRRFYEAHRADYSTEGTMSVQDLVFAAEPGAAAQTLASAEAAAQALRTAAVPEEAIKRYHLRDLRENRNEDFYFAAKLRLGDTLFAAARSMMDGSVSAPIVLDGNVHILRMLHNTAPVARNFAAAREQTFSDYKRAEAARLRAADEQYLYRKAVIQIAAPFE